MLWSFLFIVIVLLFDNWIVCLLFLVIFFVDFCCIVKFWFCCVVEVDKFWLCIVMFWFCVVSVFFVWLLWIVFVSLFWLILWFVNLFWILKYFFGFIVCILIRFVNCVKFLGFCWYVCYVCLGDMLICCSVFWWVVSFCIIVFGFWVVVMFNCVDIFFIVWLWLVLINFMFWWIVLIWFGLVVVSWCKVLWLFVV